jgi:glucose-1-phosphate cytidylyltransferase
MKVAILAGGRGSRLAEETSVRPKPMVEIGGRPILWHILMHYDHFGFREFVIALGYLGEHIKKYIVDYCSLSTGLRVDFKMGKVAPHEGPFRDWVVDLVDTGQRTQTGGRIKLLAPYLGDETFMLTWGDGVSDMDLHALLAFHRSHGKLATVTAVHPPARFGRLDLDGDRVAAFAEKPHVPQAWINGAFFVLEPGVFDYIDGDDSHFEREPMERLAVDGELMAFRHEGFWQCMDVLRDKVYLERLWEPGSAPWKLWD